MLERAITMLSTHTLSLSLPTSTSNIHRIPKPLDFEVRCPVDTSRPPNLMQSYSTCTNEGVTTSVDKEECYSRSMEMW